MNIQMEEMEYIEIELEIQNAISLIRAVYSLMQDDDPNPKLLNLYNLANTLNKHVNLLRDMLPKHGTINQYTMGCRCIYCKEAKAKYNKEYKKLKAKKK